MKTDDLIICFFIILFIFLLLFNYSCLHFLPAPPPHPRQTHPPENRKRGLYLIRKLRETPRNTWPLNMFNANKHIHNQIHIKSAQRYRASFTKEGKCLTG